MYFRPLISEWTPTVMAADLGVPTKNVRSWYASDSIPAEWFVAIERAARRRGMRHVTVKHLAAIADRRRTERSPEQQEARA